MVVIAGPRCATLVTGARRSALEAVLSVVSVILVTAEELQTLTGVRDVSQGCEVLFASQKSVLQWVVVKLGSAGACDHFHLTLSLVVV